MIEINPLKHDPPWTCKLNRILVGASPSAIMSRCLLGRMNGGRACVGCTANVREIMCEGFKQGLERGKKLPSIYEQLKAYIDEDHPSEAYKTEEEKKVDIHEPLQRNIGETEVEFVERVCETLNEGKLTPNAARKSVGLQPLDNKAEIYELILDSGILCDECGPNSPAYCAEALADLLVKNGYRRKETET